jgi:Hypothetical glycosyl hydrolase family 15
MARFPMIRRRSVKTRTHLTIFPVLLLVVVAFACLAQAATLTQHAKGPWLQSNYAARAASAGVSPALFDRETYQYSTRYTTAHEANMYSVMVLQASNGAKVAALHRANRGVKIVVYQEAVETSAQDPTGITTCTPYATAQPGWFLTDQHGHRIINRSYPGDYLMDIRQPAYQQACVSHAIAVAKRYGFDGVYFDSLDTCPCWWLPAGTSAPKYPTSASWQAATYSLISASAPPIHNRGLLLIGNIGAATASIWQQWTTPMDGSEEESWTDGGLGLAQQAPFWAGKLANVAWSEAHGKYVLLHTHNTSETGNTYGLASMMLVANGRASYSTSNACYLGCESWYPEYTTAQRLGAPAGAYTRLSNRAYRRSFANGVVLVNPTTHLIPAFPLGGTYSGSGLTNVTSVALPPTSGLILRRIGPRPRPSVRCVVPRLRHARLDQAKRALRRRHCRLGRVRKPRHSQPHHMLRVTGQSARSGTRHAAGFAVNLTLH